ncbi:MAG: phosphoribosylformylglycinamidine synthase subunit PurL [Bacteroidales bacterium]|jgi:phosphoribosylformylglycinamidine synthase|nr:phosphoribosylformylglycinamidine synthase subunit PurL [Bacteroidales bacterium]HOA09838.1 phosphoribosylformylglycinamidine synthase subunit PurL [Tenuifilaceae bacterium]MBP8643535.1 phosphoribosylformylglycinamidine synthase subunit PurL [Bacteroidales bacterium]HOC36623.1 phosphoribosylformylglycinamidine synthase subunit PurL [Tenuifilaceae bacterium]HOG72356.1 phosphoribosylformylglycinamidine synthase subunit PurL [Tenuifilaceae bacterium]
MIEHQAMQQHEVTMDTVRELGLLPEEFEMIKKFLGRVPNYTELSIYSVMWSEHASYKNSIKWIKTLPRKGSALLAEAGAENAGLVDIGGGYACAFKIESHNHPCAVEPYQGAATGVGGINRDIFTMGARPVAQLNSLRFGNPKLERTRWLMRGVVKGIGDYGNAFGIPVLAGEVFFDDSFNTNPLVNAMSVGIVSKDSVVSAVAKGVGNPVYIVGSATGKDGIHGATFASANITENSADDIPSIQVGDPFQEKILLEATQEVIKTGALVGMQDMGAAGIICSTSEMSEKGKHGMRIDLDKVPLRQTNMEAWEILLSESQERMLMVVKKGRERDVEEILNKWDIGYAVIGNVTSGDSLEFYYHNELAAKVPASSLVLGGGAPVYDREYSEPEYYKEFKKFNMNQIPEPADLVEVARFLTAHPNIASKRWVYQQYDTMIGTGNMTTNFPSDAGVFNLKELNKALAMTVDCNSRYVKADPEVGTMIAVAEAARNIVCSGATPLAITDCMNFGNPYNPEVYWQFVKAIKGMAKACKKFDTPVTGGNVSFYNQSSINGREEAVYPTPTIGMIGMLENKNHHTTLAFEEKGHMIFLIGKSRNDIASSEYLYSYHGIKQSPAPFFDLDEEFAIQQALLDLIARNLVQSAHDVSDGGLFIALLESAMPRNLGFDITTDAEIRTDAFLFGESQGRIVVSVSPSRETHFIDYMVEHGIPFTALGHVTKSEIRIDDVSFGFVADLKQLYDTALEKIMA